MAGFPFSPNLEQFVGIGRYKKKERDVEIVLGILPEFSCHTVNKGLHYLIIIIVVGTQSFGTDAPRIETYLSMPALLPARWHDLDSWKNSFLGTN